VTTTLLKPLYEVKLIADGRQHFYQIGQDEKLYPGVTTVLSVINKPALVQWASNMACQNIREYLMDNALDKPLTKDQVEKACLEGKNIYKKKASEAADVGTRVHQAIDSIIKGEKKDIPEDIQPGVDGFLSWKASNSLKIELGDTKLGSKLFGYGGSLDFVGFEGNDAVIFDIKTTKKRKDRDHGAYDEYGLQLAAYCQAFTETYGIPVKEAYVLWLNKEKPEFKAVKVSNLSVCMEAFLAALKLHQTSKFDKFEL